jgi:hypothetical protein
MRKSEQTQWAATYLVAAELTRRGYRVGWPIGNAPIKDLLVESPNGQQFYVDVKGGSYSHKQKSYWHLIQDGRVKEEPISSLYFLFVRVPLILDEGPEFYILSHGELLNLYKEMTSTPMLTKKGTPYKEFTPGFQPKHLEKYRNDWLGLPK